MIGIKPSAGGTGGVSWDYCNINTSPGAGYITAASPAAETDTNDQKLDASCAPNYTSLGSRNPVGPVVLTSAAISTTSRVWSTTKDLKLVVIWASPDTTCPNICYDGLSALVTQTLTVGYYRPYEI